MKPELANRLAAFLVGLAVLFSLERWAGLQWSALALAVLVYTLEAASVTSPIERHT
jgi:hypothetical protein